jgi:hypothetical protein
MTVDEENRCGLVETQRRPLDEAETAMCAALWYEMALRARCQAMDTLLRGISEWEHMDSAADGASWRRQIDHVLQKGAGY